MPNTEVEDLAMLVRRLAQELKKVNPSNDLAAQALGYLRRKKLEGNILRTSNAN